MCIFTGDSCQRRIQDPGVVGARASQNSVAESRETRQPGLRQLEFAKANEGRAGQQPKSDQFAAGECRVSITVGALRVLTQSILLIKPIFRSQ